MNSHKRALLGIAVVGVSALFGNIAHAQISPDGTLPTNVQLDGNTFNITGGTQAGNNLFHSFREFSVPTGGAAFFNNAVDIQNIISRVTGGNRSNIDGLIRTLGPANLFLINPNGIVFGPNASLNVGGSFVASTANSLRFADGTEFSATNPQATPLLTVSVPFGLQLGSNPEEIVNQSRASLNGALNSNNLPAGLQVPSDKTLALVGGNVSLDGGNLTAAGGRIELGSVGAGLVTLTEIPQGYALGYAGVQNFRDINLSGGALAGGALVDASGSRGGDIQVKGRNINLTDGAAIFSTTQGVGIGGNLTVDAAESVYLENNAALSTSTIGTGSAGNLTITTKKLTVNGGAFIQTPSIGQGSAGNLLVRATDAVELSGTSADGEFPSALSAQVGEQGTTGLGGISKGGNLTIETGRLIIRDGAVVNATTYEPASAGNVLVKASDIELVGFARTPNGFSLSGISTQVEEQAVENAGNAGNLTIETQRLTIRDGAQISTTARKGGNGADLSINASESIQLSGALPNATPDRGRSGIFVSANSPRATGNVGNLTINSPNGQITVKDGATIAARNEGTGLGGTLTLNVRQLTVQDGGSVQSGSFASGSGGTLTVNNAESVDVIGRGTIGSTPVDSTLSAAATASGKAGDLNITTRSLNIQDGASVTVSSPKGQAGNLTVTANDIRLNQGSLTAETAITGGEEGANIKLQGLDFLLLQNDSRISAQATDNARGGNITIDAGTRGFVVAPPLQNSDIIARASFGQGGNIRINARQIFGLTEGGATDGNRTNDIDTRSQFSQSGTVTINTLNVDPTGRLVQLPTLAVNIPELVASGCAGFNTGGNSFTITGRGGLPPSPYEPLTNDVIWTDTRLPVSTVQHSLKKPSAKPHSKPKAEPIAIVPATGWVFNGKGQVTLISNASSTNNLGSTPATCPSQK